MTSLAAGAASAETGAAVPVRLVAWLAAGVLFVGLRLAAAFTLPVFGAEIDHLSGAWQASIGVDDHRFVPTLFQGLSAGLLRLDSDETWPRLVAVALTALVPFAVYRLRGTLGEGAAFLALCLLALNPLGIALSSTANAMALDEAVAVVLFVLLVTARPGPVVAGGAGAAVALSGPAPLLVLLGWAVTRRQRPEISSPALLAGIAGGAAGLVIASSRFGLGFDDLVVPPLDLFAAGSERTWSTASAGELVLLYLLPVLAAAPAAAATSALGASPRLPAALWAWAGLAGGWWVLSLAIESPAPAAAASVPAVLVLAPAALAVLRSGLGIDWRIGAAGLALLTVMLILAGAVVADWARLERAGDASDKALILIFGLGALGAAAGLVYGRAGAALAFPAAVLTVGFLLAGATRMATGASAEPLVSPQSAEIATVLRERALEAAAVTGGEIVVHPDLAEDVTWPFRDSTTLHVSSRVGPNAAIVLWPESLPAPEGMERLDGDWALTAAVRTPTADTLDYLHWLLDRNMLAARPDRIAVYSRTEQ